MRSIYIAAGSVVLLVAGFYFARGSLDVRRYSLLLCAGSCLMAGAGAAGLLLWLPRARFRDRLRSLEPLEGKDEDEVLAVLGAPALTERRKGGRVAYLTWQVDKLRVTIKFKDGECEGIVREER